MMDCRVIFWGALMVSAAVCHIPQVSEFFPEVEDMSQITWGHAINSVVLLNQALTNDSFMMLEADVSKGQLVNATASQPIPIMAHPPHKTSDISLEMWIDRIIEANMDGKKKGVKLDFKDLGIVLSSLEILQKKSKMLNFPLWLNADILKGPGSNKTPVDAGIFLSLCKEFFPEATLSLGWTTMYIPGRDLKYTTDMMNEMIETLERNNIKQPVTFPIRAAFVGASLEELESFYRHQPDYYTFTIWTASTDDVNVDDLVKFQSSVGISSVFVDLPPYLMEQFKEAQMKLTGQNRSTSINSTNFITSLMLCVALSLFAAQYLWH